MRTIIAASFTSILIMTGPLAADESSIKGSLAYTEEMNWDYNRDNTIERVQYWADIDIKGEGDTVKGGMRKYLKDLDSGRKIYHWHNMQMTGDNTRPVLPATHLAVKGKTAEFTVGDITYTVTDNSALSGETPPTLIVDDGLTRIELKIYAGEVTVHGP